MSVAKPGGTDRPQGTVEELRANNMSPARYGSCHRGSKRGTNEDEGRIIGCQFFDKCCARSFRDGIKDKTNATGHRGPANGAIAVILNDGDGNYADLKEMPCYEMHFSGLIARREQAHNTGEVIRIMGWEGDGKTYEFQQRGSIREHAKRPDPACPSCQTGVCYKMTELPIEKRPVEPYPRPRAIYKGQALAAKLRGEMLDEMEQQREEQMISAKLTRGTDAEEPAS